jgi:hypothetical protein
MRLSLSGILMPHEILTHKNSSAIASARGSKHQHGSSKYVYGPDAYHLASGAARFE